MALDEKSMLNVSQVDSEGERSRMSFISAQGDSLRSVGGDSASDIHGSSPVRRTLVRTHAFRVGGWVMLCAISGALGFCAFYFARAREQDAFQMQFDKDAEHIIDSFNDLILQTRLETICYAFLSTSATSIPWPFVTMDTEFEAATFSILRHSLAIAAFFAPIVSDDDRLDWEAYAISARPDVQYISSGNRSISDGFYRFEDGVPEDRLDAALYYSPIWNVAPSSLEGKYIMFDQASDEIQRTALENLIAYKSIISSGVFMSDAGAPQFLQFFPIFDDVRREKVVATMSLLMDVSSMIGAQVSACSAAINIVLDTSRGHQFTFEVVGASDGVTTHSTYLGAGDLHDSSYDALRRVSDPKARLKAWGEVLSTAPKTIAELYPETCQGVAEEDVYAVCGFKLSLYPTKQYESTFHSQFPITIALVISLVLFCAANLIFVFCFLVERRQQDVIRETIRERDIDAALVKSFYPKFVRDRVVRAHKGKSSSRINQPIAEQFQNTTVVRPTIHLHPHRYTPHLTV